MFAYFPRLRERRKQAAGTMSGGEQQMLVVARALMSSPKLLIVDELSLGLAPKIVNLVFEIIRDVNAEGTAVLIVEQFVHMALENTDRAYVPTNVKVVLEGRSSDLAGSEELLSSSLVDEVDPAGEPPVATTTTKASARPFTFDIHSPSIDRPLPSRALAQGESLSPQADQLRPLRNGQKG